MALVLSAVPITGVPATVMGGYGGGGGGGITGPLIWPFYYVIPPAPLGPATNTIDMTLLRQYVVVDNLDLSSLTINGVNPLKFEWTADGLVLTFDLNALNLAPGADHITLTGKYKDGTPFSISIPIVITP